jgi:hypothetical protein
MRLEDFFGGIYLINLARRPDRLQQSISEFMALGIPFGRVTIFEAYDRPEGNANRGCTESHRGVLELIAHAKSPKPSLVLEDDFLRMYTNSAKRFHVDVQAAFSVMQAELPADWGLLYLAAHYGNMPRERVSPHLIRPGNILTTGAYGVTADMAREMAPYISGTGPIDNLFWRFSNGLRAYVADSPRLFVQRPSVSDLHDKFEDYVSPLMDTNHVKALDAGTVYPPPAR